MLPWPHMLKRHDENTRRAYNYEFQWTPLHSSPEDMHPQKFSYDQLGEDCLNKLDEISPPPDPQLPRNQSRLQENGKPVQDAKTLKRDLYLLLEEHHENDARLNELWHQVNDVPNWVDWAQIERGQDVFYRYGGPAFVALAYCSLLGGMGADRVVETLARTGGFGVKVAKHRIYETTQHILQCTRSLESVQPGGDGFKSSIRVRLLHAAVRRRIMRLAKDRPEYYDVEKLGIPINDLDSIGTIATFSSTLIWVGFPRQGIYMRQQEIIDYIALWRWVAHIVGTPTQPFESPEKARAIMESLMLSEIKPTETSRLLANNIILSLAGQAPSHASREMLTASARWLNGSELGDALGLAKMSPYYTILMAGQCLFFMAICYTYRSFDYLDRKKIKTLKILLYRAIVENKNIGALGEESVFDFKYIPNVDFTTEAGKYDSSTKQSTSIETRNLKVFVIASVAMAGISWATYSVTRWIGGTVWGLVGNFLRS